MDEGKDPTAGRQETTNGIEARGEDVAAVGVDFFQERIRQLESERVHWMSIVYPVEEWLAGRFTLEEMRESVIRNLAKAAT